MADFNVAIPFILKHEGGYAETAAGEVVNRGVNIDTLKALGYKGTHEELKKKIQNLTEEETKTIYHQHYWTLAKPSLRDGLDQLNSQSTANKLLDIMVLSGQRSGIKIAQRATGLGEDGIFGPVTLKTLNSFGDTMIDRLVVTWSNYLTSIADRKIASSVDPGLLNYWKRVKKGWLARASWKGI